MSGLARVRDRLLESPLVYGLWQKPFVEQKLEPVRRHNDMAAIRRVLDVACGPGTNTAAFAHADDYVGIDINPAYIDVARARHDRTFIVADATRYRHEDGAGFDFILVNSFLHHLDDDAVRAVLGHLATLLSPGGAIHVLELVLPARPSAGRLLARLDRGRHARPLDAWRALFREHFAEQVFEPYAFGVARLPLWRMVYFRGGARP